MSAITEPQQKRRRPHAGNWPKGVSGNPAGRPRGSRHKATLAAEALLDGEAEALTRKAIEKAKEGDGAALRLCLERIVPARKERAVSLELPKIETTADSVKAVGAIIDAVASGELTPGEGGDVVRIVEAFMKSTETQALEARIKALEEKAKQ
jgi:hypothetical protein